MGAHEFELGPGFADIEFSFGARNAGLLPVAGDWKGRGRDSVGLYVPMHSNWFLQIEMRSGDEVETVNFGVKGGIPVVGDWNADGIDELGVYLPEQREALLADTDKLVSTCSRVFFDLPGTWPVAGRWA